MFLLLFKYMITYIYVIESVCVAIDSRQSDIMLVTPIPSASEVACGYSTYSYCFTCFIKASVMLKCFTNPS